MRNVADWLSAHPEAWPLIAMLFTAICRPTSPEEYARIAARWPAWFWTRWAAFTQLVGSLGIDPNKAVESLRKVTTGRVDPIPQIANVGSVGHNLASDVLGPNGGGGTTSIPNRDTFLQATKLDLMRAWAQRGDPVDEATEAKAEILALEIYERGTRTGKLGGA